jgi:hypothetical protein
MSPLPTPLNRQVFGPHAASKARWSARREAPEFLPVGGRRERVARLRHEDDWRHARAKTVIGNLVHRIRPTSELGKG